MLSFVKYCLIFLISTQLFSGVYFTDPVVTPPGSPDLSFSGQNASVPQIATDTRGKYVYAVWRRNDGVSEIIQIAVSDDYGQTWGNSINLSSSGQNAGLVQIATDISGKYIYVIWNIIDRIQISKSDDYGLNWSDPIDISIPPEPVALQSQIATDASGKYIYAAWLSFDGSNLRIKTVHSDDYGQNWSIPIYLSDPGMDATLPQITVDSSGTYVYVIWRQDVGAGNSAIQAVSSDDHAQNWSIPINLSASDQFATDPQIALNSSGRYIYAIWSRFDGSNDIIQTAHSDNYGQTWSSPIDLSLLGLSASGPQISVESSGGYVYTAWSIFDGSNSIIQTANSDDYGQTWNNPITTPSGISPNLSALGQSATSAQISADDSGRYINALWMIFDEEGNSIIQAANSEDYGQSWRNPISTPSGIIPNLSVSGQSSSESQLIVNSNGKYVYAIWNRFDGSNNIIQIAVGGVKKVFFPVIIFPGAR
ncbi:MAG: sialidase family protein [Parachlamydiales bacterium]